MGWARPAPEFWLFVCGKLRLLSPQSATMAVCATLRWSAVSRRFGIAKTRPISALCVSKGGLCHQSSLYCCGHAERAAWLREPGQWRLFWITAYSLFPVISLFIDDARLPMSNIVRGFTMPVSAIQQIALWFLLMWLLQLQRDRRLVRVTELIALISLCAAVLQGLVEGFLWSAAWDSDWVTSVRIADGLLGGLRYLLSAFPLVLIASAVIRRRRLDQAGWVLSAFAGIRVLLGFLGALISFTWPLTHWGLVNRFYGPLFEVNGGGVSVLTLADTLRSSRHRLRSLPALAEKRRRQTVLEQEFKSAREVQQVLIPETVPDDSRVRAHQRLSSSAGGRRRLLPDHSA